jgi:peptidoglycan/LPS O-acetylase OafA/YrhL
MAFLGAIATFYGLIWRFWMRSSSGEYYLGLDQLRAVAAYFVFMWHFLHGAEGNPIPFHVRPAPPFALIDEGHLGVSLFMCLSGYLFSRLLQDREVKYLGFIWNRFLRLAPLLVFVLLVCWVRLLINDADNVAIASFYNSVIQGWRLPSLPNGGWSITVEFQFYLILPALLWLLSKFGSWALMFILVASIGLRAFLFFDEGSVQLLSYLTLIGRIDQFMLGMWAATSLRRRGVSITTLAVFLIIIIIIYQAFDACGGFYGCKGFPSRSPLWILMPTVEGMFFVVLICWCDSREIITPSKMTLISACVGQWSYGLYLLHPFWVFAAASWWCSHFEWVSNFYGALLVGSLTYLASLPLAWLSWRLIEQPFLKYRVRYIRA